MFITVIYLIIFNLLVCIPKQIKLILGIRFQRIIQVRIFFSVYPRKNTYSYLELLV